MSTIIPSHPNPPDKSTFPMSDFTPFQELPREASNELSREEPTSGHKSVIRAVNKFFGFQKSYDLVLWIIFGGALFGFCLTRIQLFSSKSTGQVVTPGEWFWYRRKTYNVGLIIHLVGMFPFCILALPQFVPSVLKKLPLFHRVNGYIIILCLLMGNVGGLMIIRHTSGGTLGFQIAMGFLTLATTITGGLAYFTILKLQIDRHRKWMLRTVFYVAVPVTARFIVMSSARILGHIGSPYYTTWRCDELAFTMKNSTRFQNEYPSCGDGMGPSAIVAVLAGPAPAERRGSHSRLALPGALWIALMIHAVGVEIYLHLTPHEHERLRQLSQERQAEASLKNSGGAGLGRFGEGDLWSPTTAGPLPSPFRLYP